MVILFGEQCAQVIAAFCARGQAERARLFPAIAPGEQTAVRIPGMNTAFGQELTRARVPEVDLHRITCRSTRPRQQQYGIGFVHLPAPTLSLPLGAIAARSIIVGVLAEPLWQERLQTNIGVNTHSYFDRQAQTDDLEGVQQIGICPTSQLTADVLSVHARRCRHDGDARIPEPVDRQQAAGIVRYEGRGTSRRSI